MDSPVDVVQASSSELVKEYCPHPEEYREAMRLEGWLQRTASRPSFETPREERGSSG
jgi:hypothetical protein